ncbi:hypothetical protein [Rhodoferax sp. GW822-FHT02A01]|uniref:hypothetical protein n=1 Tax=Rhodoferax sp. GW822-FHT02A01 TaxID=3141537 RepID=UPI00315CFD19
MFHGESRQDASRVQVQVEPAGQSDSYNLKITSSTPVDEPVVTVYLRAGCGQKSSRKYVLLADFPPDSQSQPVRAAPVVPQVPTVVTPAAPAESAPAQTSPKPEPAVAAPVAPPKAAKTPKPAKAAIPKEATKEPARKKEPAPKPAAKPEKPVEPPAAQAKGTGKSRLKLDPVETLAERVKNLEATTTQSSLQDDMARDAQKMQQLQTDLRTLLDQAVKNEASLAAMRERLEKAEADRVPVAVVYGLVALVALCLAALAYLWTRRGQPIRWERDVPSARAKAAADDNV